MVKFWSIRNLYVCSKLMKTLIKLKQHIKRPQLATKERVLIVEKFVETKVL